MRPKTCRKITLTLTPNDIELLKNCDAIQLDIKSTTNETRRNMWVYTDKFLSKLGYD